MEMLVGEFDMVDPVDLYAAVFTWTAHVITFVTLQVKMIPCVILLQKLVRKGKQEVWHGYASNVQKYIIIMYKTGKKREHPNENSFSFLSIC